MLDQRIAAEAAPSAPLVAQPNPKWRPLPRCRAGHGGWMVKASEVMAMIVNGENEVALETSLRNCAGSWEAFNLVRKSLSWIRNWLPSPYS